MNTMPNMQANASASISSIKPISIYGFQMVNPITTRGITIMGNKLVPGEGEKKGKEFESIVEKCYDKHFDGPRKEEEPSIADFYRIVCETVEEINEKLGNTQFRVPKVATLRRAYENHHQGKGKALTKEEFQKIMEMAIIDTGFTGVGAKDILMYIFGVPVTALLIKQRVAPRAITNDIFIPVVTSATVFLLAKLNKI